MLCFQGMLSFLCKNVTLIALVTASASLGTGCYADAQLEPTSAYGYEPQYYDGYVVYYDGGGRPYYHNGGAISWVPADSPAYGGYVAHYRTNGAAYGRWNAGTGARFHGYRAGARTRR
jgi:hypothetical protein